MAGPFGDALMRYSRTRAPGGGGASFGGRAPNADAIRMSTPAPGAIKPSEAASEAQLPPEIQSYLSMMTGTPGAAAGVMSPPIPPAPPAAPVAPEPSVMEGLAPVEPTLPPLPPTIPVAMRIRAPRPPDMDVQTLAITAPDETWQAAFYDRNGRRPNASDYQQRHFAADMIRRTGGLPTKAEWLFQAFGNLDQEPGGISEFA